MHCGCTRVKNTTPKFLYNKANYNQIREELDIDWDGELEGKDVLNSWELLKSKLTSTAANHIPKVLLNRRKQRPTWINPSAIAKIKKKHAAWKRYLATKDGQAYQLFARARNQAKWECQKACKAYEKEIAKQSKDNPKAFWGYVNSKLKNKENVADLHTDGDSATTDQQKADTLSNFFKQVFAEEDSSILPEFEAKESTSPLEDISFTEDDVKTLLKEINVNKSQGPDLLHPRLLFQAREQFNMKTSVPHISKIN